MREYFNFSRKKLFFKSQTFFRKKRIIYFFVSKSRIRKTKKKSNIQLKEVLRSLKKEQKDFASSIDMTSEGVKKAARGQRIRFEKLLLMYALECAGFDVLQLIASKFETEEWFKTGEKK